MNIAVLTGKAEYLLNPQYLAMAGQLEAAGHSLSVISDSGLVQGNFRMLLSIGGDGTFLTAASKAAPHNIPVLGVNMGRLGFLSENLPGKVAEAIVSGEYCIEERSLICAVLPGRKFYALNEIVASRNSSAMLGIKVNVNGKDLPIYWADGLLVSTPSGSTAYSLSAGGPIVLPESKVLIITPIAPHNLNIRPLILPQESKITIGFCSRDKEVLFSADNTHCRISERSVISVEMAQFSLKRVCLKQSNFINALSEKLFWGMDKRNEYNGEQF